MTWKNEHRCVKCGATLTTNKVYHSDGRCPACGHKDIKTGPVVDTYELGYKLVRCGKWWQFWKTKRIYK